MSRTENLVYGAALVAFAAAPFYLGSYELSLLGRFLASAIQHGLREVATDERKPVSAGIAEVADAYAFHRKGQVARAAAQIQNARVRAPQDAVKFLRRAKSPVTVQRKR